MESTATSPCLWWAFEFRGRRLWSELKRVGLRQERTPLQALTKKKPSRCSAALWLYFIVWMLIMRMMRRRILDAGIGHWMPTAGSGGPHSERSWRYCRRNSWPWVRLVSNLSMTWWHSAFRLLQMAALTSCSVRSMPHRSVLTFTWSLNVFFLFLTDKLNI